MAFPTTFHFAVLPHAAAPAGAETLFTALATETDHFATGALGFGTATTGAGVEVAVLTGEGGTIAAALDILDAAGLVAPGGHLGGVPVVTN